MLQNCMRAGAIVTLAVLLYAAVDLRFLFRYWSVLANDYAAPVGLAALVLFLNVTAISYTLLRSFGMKTTGQKLQHMDAGLNTGESVMPELSERLERE
jgi:hypothetical protein